MPRPAHLLLLVAALVAVLLAVVPSAGAAQRRPNDPLLRQAWHLGAIEAPRAWASARGGDVVVAVLDTGIDLRHPELRPNLWRNPDEVAGNGRDDDGNGVVDDVHGADLVAGDGVPQDAHGHGTHVAGVIGARGDDRRGTPGVAWRVRLMAVRVLDAHNAGTTTDFARGVDYAVAEGARVINLALNSDVDDPAVEAALGRARDAGVLVVASAGNGGRDLRRAGSFPVCSPLRNVLGVAATRRDGRLAGFSNRGGCLDLTAPGVDIAATRLGGGSERRTGTSQSAAQVSGAAAVVLAARPRLPLARLVRALTAGTRGARAALRGVPRLSLARALRDARRAR